MAKKRGPNLDEIYLGKEPLFDGTEQFTQSEWANAAKWYNYFYKSKDYMPDIIRFAKEYCKYDKKKIAILKRTPDWKFMPVQKKIKLYHRGWRYTGAEMDEAKDFIDGKYKAALKIKQAEEKAKPKVVVIPPAEKTRRKIVETIYGDWDEIIVEGWYDGNYTQKFGCYNRFKMHGLKGNAIAPFLRMIEPEYENIKAAYEKTCDQCVEAYSHITKGNKRKILKQFEEVFADLERLKDSFKAQRTPRATKPKSSDAQVSKLQYCKEDVDVKLTSINPILIPSARKLFVYNRKNRKLIEYTTTATAGFIVSGTSIKNFDGDSRQATLRKPDDILPDVLNKTEKQIEKIWKGITTKIDKPTGRINSDCILLRVIQQ